MKQMFETIKEAYSETPNEIIGGVLVMMTWAALLFIGITLTAIL